MIKCLLSGFHPEMALFHNFGVNAPEAHKSAGQTGALTEAETHTD
jgi:hypothetical protein